MAQCPLPKYATVNKLCLIADASILFFLFYLFNAQLHNVHVVSNFQALLRKS